MLESLRLAFWGHMPSFLENLFVKYNVTAFLICSQVLEKAKKRKRKNKQKDNLLGLKQELICLLKKNPKTKYNKITRMLIKIEASKCICWCLENLS